MADVTRFDSTRFVNNKNGVFNSLHGWLPWQRAYFEDYCFEAIDMCLSGARTETKHILS